jgi:phospholipid/cholesterol/gamma-HCH transport system substrate-binding protein
VRQGTHAKQVTLQFIANEKAIELNPGDPLLPELAEGASIPTEVQTEFIEQGRTIADALQEITIDMRDILQSIKNREGLIGRAISDPQFGRKGLVELESALASADQLLARANRGEGLLGKALADQAFATQLVQDLQAAGRGFAAVARRLEAGEGLLGAMTRGEEGVAVISDLKNLTASFQAVAKALQNGDGLAGLLLHDRVRAERIAANLDETLSRLASIARKVDEGQGTLGLLVNDRKLHDDVQQLVTGAKGRTLAGRVLRHYYERGAKQSEGSQPPPSDHSRPAGDPPPGGSY